MQQVMDKNLVDDSLNFTLDINRINLKRYM